MKRRIFNFCLFLILLFSGGFFILPKTVLGQEVNHLVISEVQITGGPGKTDHDFVEIYNPTSNPIDLKGYRLVKRSAKGTSDVTIKSWTSSIFIPPHSYYLWANSNYQTIPITPDATTTDTLSENNGIALRYGPENTGTIIDSLAWGEANNFIEGNVFPQNPQANQSLERKPGNPQGNYQDTDNNAFDFFLQTTPNPQNSQSPPQPPLSQQPPSSPSQNLICGNGLCEEGEDENNCPSDCPPSLPPFSPSSSLPFALPGDIVINEFLPNPSHPEEKEWIELFNKTDNNFDLTDWKIYDGTNKEIAPLSGNILAKSFLVLELSSARLNNGGDIIILKNNQGTIIDQVTYGNWDDGNLEDNAPTPQQGNSLARKTDGQDTDIDNQDFRETITPTKGTSNLITRPNNTQPPIDNSSNNNFNNNFSPSEIVINEFLPNPTEGKEWIEIYLNKEREINLEGWKILDGTGKVILNLKGIVSPASRIIAFDLDSSRLNNDGDLIVLKAPDGTIIDQVAYGNWNNNSSSNASGPKQAGQSLARKINGFDTDNDSIDFALTNQPTKGAPNIIFQIEKVSGNNLNNLSEKYIVPQPILVINEFVSDPVDNEEEWVEIYNAGNVSVDLNGWYLEEGSKSKTPLSGTIMPGQFLVVSPIKGNLNNAGDIIYLKDPQGKVFDRVAYGTFQDGDLSDNAPVASDPFSVARRSDGYRSGKPNQDFIITLPTKGQSNQNDGEINEEANKKEYPEQIILNEIFPNPKGDEIKEEFIELKNLETKPVSLNGWYLKDESGKKYVFNQTTLYPQAILFVKREQSGIILNNNRDSVFLYAPNNLLKDKVSYQETKEGFSLARFSDNWQWTSEPTMGQENILKNKNHPPEISWEFPTEVLVGETVELDASDSSDEDDDPLTFSWSIENKQFKGPTINYTFQKPGEYLIALEVSDGKSSVKKEGKIRVQEKIDYLVKNLYLSELMPNPEGSDLAEWIELFNASEEVIDLTGFQLKDASKKFYRFPPGTKINPHSYLVIERLKSGISLNNRQETLQLFDAWNNLIDEVSYQEAPQGLSYSRLPNGQFIWTTPTKGKPNQTKPEIFTQGKNKNQSRKKPSVVLKLSLKEAHEEELGETVQVEGIVSVPPNVLGSQIFYLAGSGMQVYMFKKDFPPLALGDLVRVTGELSENQGERRIKITRKEDIEIISHHHPLSAQEISTQEIEEKLAGSLVSLAGIVIEQRGRRAVIDDGNGELSVYFKPQTGLEAKKLLKEGMKVKIVGILHQIKNDFELLPRFENDIEILAEAPIETNKNEQILNVSQSSTVKTAKNYLTITATGLGSLLLGLGLRSRFLKIIPFGLITALFRRKTNKE
jgi:DNA/RNA endonuclease YhcR with UshA esterase domain